MRRGFKKSLLPKEAPKKGKYFTQGKSKERKSAMLRILLWDWRRQYGEDFKLEDFANIRIIIGPSLDISLRIPIAQRRYSLRTFDPHMRILKRHDKRSYH
jgi:hypothetical protein